MHLPLGFDQMMAGLGDKGSFSLTTPNAPAAPAAPTYNHTYPAWALAMPHDQGANSGTLMPEYENVQVPGPHGDVTEAVGDLYGFYQMLPDGRYAHYDLNGTVISINAPNVQGDLLSGIFGGSIGQFLETAIVIGMTVYGVGAAIDAATAAASAPSVTATLTTAENASEIARITSTAANIAADNATAAATVQAATDATVTAAQTSAAAQQALANVAAQQATDAAAQAAAAQAAAENAAEIARVTSTAANVQAANQAAAAVVDTTNALNATSTLANFAQQVATKAGQVALQTAQAAAVGAVATKVLGKNASSIINMGKLLMGTVTTDNGDGTSTVTTTDSTGATYSTVYSNSSLDANGNPIPSVTTVASTDGTIQTVSSDGSTVIQLPSGGTQTTIGNNGSAEAGWTYTTDAYGNTTISDANGNLITPAAAQIAGAATTPVAAGVSDLVNTLSTISSGAQSVLSTVKSFLNIGSPPVVSAAQTKLGNGSTVVYNRNGTITTTDLQGHAVTTLMPVGKPYVFSDGSTVVNQGDGTILTISQNGSQSTSKIGVTTTTTSGTSVAIFAAIALALVALSKK